jgi:hypothetical protein
MRRRKRQRGHRGPAADCSRAEAVLLPPRRAGSTGPSLTRGLDSARHHARVHRAPRLAGLGLIAIDARLWRIVAAWPVVTDDPKLQITSSCLQQHQNATAHFSEE